MVPDDWYEAGLTVYLRGMNSGQSAYRAAKGRLADVTTLREWDAVLQSKFDKKVRRPVRHTVGGVQRRLQNTHI